MSWKRYLKRQDRGLGDTVERITTKTGIKIHPISNPMALILSETATAFNPPKTA